MTGSPTTAQVVEVSIQRPFDDVRVVSETVEAPGRGQVLVEIEQFSLSTNNLAYVLLGDALGHLHAFPTTEGWTRPPVWAAARVIDGDQDVAPIGQRLTGYLPMATHAVIRAERTTTGILAVEPTRTDMPSIYRRLTDASSPGFPAHFGDADTVLLPVYPFAAVLSSDLAGAGIREVVVSSASSRSASGLARMLSHVGIATVGLTSERHERAVRVMDSFAKVTTYEHLADDLHVAEGAAYVDVAGSATVTAAVHDLLGGRLAVSYAVGGSHLRQLPGPPDKPLAAPDPVRFSVGAREDDIAESSGMETVADLERQAQQQLAPWASRWLQIERLAGVDKVAATWRRIAAGDLDPLRATVIVP